MPPKKTNKGGGTNNNNDVAPVNVKPDVRSPDQSIHRTTLGYLRLLPQIPIPAQITQNTSIQVGDSFENPISDGNAKEGQEKGEWESKFEFPGIPKKKFTQRQEKKEGKNHSWKVQNIYIKNKKGRAATYVGWNATAIWEETWIKEFRKENEKLIEAIECRDEFLKAVSKDLTVHPEARKIAGGYTMWNYMCNPDHVFWLYEDLTYFHSQIQLNYGLPEVFYVCLRMEEVEPPKFQYSTFNIVRADTFKDFIQKKDYDLPAENPRDPKRRRLSQADTICEKGDTCVCDKLFAKFFAERAQINHKPNAEGLIDLTNQQRSILIECSSACGCSAKCPRRRLQEGQTKRLVVFFENKFKGLGLRAAEAFDAGEFICEWIGVVRKLEDEEEKYERHRIGFEVMEKELVIDASEVGNLARFIHFVDVDPSAILVETFSRVHESDPLIPRISVYALKPIAIGDKITVSNKQVWKNEVRCRDIEEVPVPAVARALLPIEEDEQMEIPMEEVEEEAPEPAEDIVEQEAPEAPAAIVEPLDVPAAVEQVLEAPAVVEEEEEAPIVVEAPRPVEEVPARYEARYRRFLFPQVMHYFEIQEENDRLEREAHAQREQQRPQEDDIVEVDENLLEVEVDVEEEVIRNVDEEEEQENEEVDALELVEPVENEQAAGEGDDDDDEEEEVDLEQAAEEVVNNPNVNEVRDIMERIVRRIRGQQNGEVGEVGPVDVQVGAVQVAVQHEDVNIEDEEVGVENVDEEPMLDEVAEQAGRQQEDVDENEDLLVAHALVEVAQPVQVVANDDGDEEEFIDVEERVVEPAVFREVDNEENVRIQNEVDVDVENAGVEPGQVVANDVDDEEDFIDVGGVENAEEAEGVAENVNDAEVRLEQADPERVDADEVIAVEEADIENGEELHGHEEDDEDEEIDVERVDEEPRQVEAEEVDEEEEEEEEEVDAYELWLAEMENRERRRYEIQEDEDEEIDVVGVDEAVAVQQEQRNDEEMAEVVPEVVGDQGEDDEDVEVDVVGVDPEEEEEVDDEEEEGDEVEEEEAMEIPEDQPQEERHVGEENMDEDEEEITDDEDEDEEELMEQGEIVAEEAGGRVVDDEEEEIMIDEEDKVDASEHQDEEHNARQIPSPIRDEVDPDSDDSRMLRIVEEDEDEEQNGGPPEEVAPSPIPRVDSDNEDEDGAEPHQEDHDDVFDLNVDNLLALNGEVREDDENPDEEDDDDPQEAGDEEEEDDTDLFDDDRRLRDVITAITQPESLALQQEGLDRLFLGRPEAEIEDLVTAVNLIASRFYGLARSPVLLKASLRRRNPALLNFLRQKGYLGDDAEDEVEEEEENEENDKGPDDEGGNDGGMDNGANGDDLDGDVDDAEDPPNADAPQGNQQRGIEDNARLRAAQASNGYVGQVEEDRSKLMAQRDAVLNAFSESEILHGGHVNEDASPARLEENVVEASEKRRMAQEAVARIRAMKSIFLNEILQAEQQQEKPMEVEDTLQPLEPCLLTTQPILADEKAPCYLPPFPKTACAHCQEHMDSNPATYYWPIPTAAEIENWKAQIEESKKRFEEYLERHGEGEKPMIDEEQEEEGDMFGNPESQSKSVPGSPAASIDQSPSSHRSLFGSPEPSTSSRSSIGQATTPVSSSSKHLKLVGNRFGSPTGPSNEQEPEPMEDVDAENQVPTSS